MADATDTVTLTIESEDDRDELTVPSALIDLLEEDGESAPEIVGDVALFGMAQRIHAAVHHAHDEPGEDLRDLEDLTMELFEQRFGLTFGEATGHDH